MELGWPGPKRMKMLDSLASKSSEHQETLVFQGEERHLHVHPVPIGLPKYRLSNGRTQAAQEEYLATHDDKPDGFFEDDWELNESQAVQHDLLYQLVGERGLLDFFKKNKQVEPLYLDHKGFVLNGNRRLCAMRDLYAKQPQTYAHFENVRIVILPPADENALDDLEASLQIEPDIKADYAWTARICMLRARQNRHKLSDENLAARYRMTKKEVLEDLSILDIVDSYLESRDSRKLYGKVKASEYAFKQIFTARRKITEPGKRQLFQELAFNLVDGDESIPGRIYSHIPALHNNLDTIAARLREQLSVEDNGREPQEADDLFGVVDDPVIPLIEVIRQQDDKKVVIENVIDVIETEKTRKQQQSQKNYLLKRVRDANTALMDALNARSNSVSSSGVNEQLQSITDAVEQLKEWLARD